MGIKCDICKIEDATDQQTEFGVRVCTCDKCHEERQTEYTLTLTVVELDKIYSHLESMRDMSDDSSKDYGELLDKIVEQIQKQQGV